MNKDQLIGPYKTFFESPSGLYFIQNANNMLQSLHRDSEDYPDNARDNAQRAKGIRELLDHIGSVMLDIKREAKEE